MRSVKTTGDTALVNRGDHIGANELTPSRVRHQRRIESLKLCACILSHGFYSSETSRTNHDVVSKWARRSLLLSIDTISHRAALHEDDRMMAIFSGHRGGQPGDEPGFGAAGHHFEAVRRQVMALIHH